MTRDKMRVHSLSEPKMGVALVAQELPAKAPRERGDPLRAVGGARGANTQKDRDFPCPLIDQHGMLSQLRLPMAGYALPTNTGNARACTGRLQRFRDTRLVWVSVDRGEPPHVRGAVENFFV